jgi:hypothetical protein
MSNNFWDDAVSKDGEEKTTKEEKLDLSKPISKSPKSDIVVFTNPLDIQIDFKEIQLALPNPNELTDEAIELILSSKDCWIINLAPGERFFQMDMKSNEFEYWFDGEMIHQQKGDIGQALAYLETLIPENLSDNGISEINTPISSRIQEFNSDNEDDDGTIAINSGTWGGLAAGWGFTIFWCSISFFVTVMIGGPLLADLGTGDWPETEGVITSSEVYSSQDSEGGTTYCLDISYEYTVDNVKYKGYRVSYSSEDSCDSWSQNADEEYPEGKTIPVYYDPSDPSESVLETGFAGVDFFLCCFFIFPLIGLVMLYGASKSTFNKIMNREQNISSSIDANLHQYHE